MKLYLQSDDHLGTKNNLMSTSEFLGYLPPKSPGLKHKNK